jgi:predicted hydrocarbon binding protein
MMAQLKSSRRCTTHGVIFSERMCAIAKGIARCLAAHYRETVRVGERACMLKGDPECRITVRTD